MCQINLVVGESSPKEIAKPLLEKLVKDLGINIQLTDVSDWSDTHVRAVFHGSDMSVFDSIMEDAKSYIYDNDKDEDAFRDLGHLSLSNAHLQDDGSYMAIFDVEFMEGVKTWRGVTEEDVINQFEEMLQECEFYVNGNRVRFIKDYKELDEIMCDQHFNDWVDNEITEGRLPDVAENYSV